MAAKIPAGLLRAVEKHFICTYEVYGTEERLLIYQDGAGILLVTLPRMERSAGSVQGDVALTMVRDGTEWDLVMDLHSHHVMGAFWSSTDDANERLRGIAFGVFSWQAGLFAWLFRRFTGQGFEDLPYEAVVGDG